MECIIFEKQSERIRKLKLESRERAKRIMMIMNIKLRLYCMYIINMFYLNKKKAI